MKARNRKYRLYTAIMRLYPQAYRNRYKDEILQTYADLVSDSQPGMIRVKIKILATIELIYEASKMRISHLKVLTSKPPLYSVMATIGLVALGITVSIVYGQNSSLRTALASTTSQLENPTTACRLLPLSAAKLLLGRDAYMINAFANKAGSQLNTSGEIYDKAGIQVTTCHYEAKPSYGKNEAPQSLTMEARETSNPQAQAELQAAFQSYNPLYEKPIQYRSTTAFMTVQGIPTLRVWVNNRWLAVTAPTDTEAITVMDKVLDAPI